MINDISKFNSQLDFSRDQWNAQNSQAVEMSNVDWRRKSNLANTAVQNEINMRNSMNAFDLSKTSMAMLWQELRDKADYEFKASENVSGTNKIFPVSVELGIAILEVNISFIQLPMVNDIFCSSLLIISLNKILEHLGYIALNFL